MKLNALRLITPLVLLLAGSAYSNSDDWIETANTHTTTVEVEFVDEFQNTTGSGVTWDWYIFKTSHWKITGSSTQNPPAWASFVTPLRDDTWGESNDGEIYVPNNWWMVYKATSSRETGHQTWYSDDLDTEIRRDLDKKDYTELTAIVSKVSLVPN